MNTASCYIIKHAHTNMCRGYKTHLWCFILIHDFWNEWTSEL